MARILNSYAVTELSGRTQNIIPVSYVDTNAAFAALDRATRTIDGLASWSFLQRIGVGFTVTGNSIAVSSFITVGDILSVNKEMKFYAAGRAYQLEQVPVAEIRKKATTWQDAMPTAFAYYRDGTTEKFYFNGAPTEPLPVVLQLYYSKRMALPSTDLVTTNQIACELPDNYSELVVDVAVWQQKEKYLCSLSEVDKSNVIESLRRFAREYNASVEEIQNINDEAIRRGQ